MRTKRPNSSFRLKYHFEFSKNCPDPSKAEPIVFSLANGAGINVLAAIRASSNCLVTVAIRKLCKPPQVGLASAGLGGRVYWLMSLLLLSPVSVLACVYHKTQTSFSVRVKHSSECQCVAALWPWAASHASEIHLECYYYY